MNITKSFVVMVKASKIIFISLLICFNSLFQCLFGQANNWQRIYSGPSTNLDFIAKSICKSDGENTMFFINDNNQRECVYKLNSLGEITQVKYYTDRMGDASVSSGDGGVVFSSNANDPYSSKIDLNLSDIWFKIYNFGGNGSHCNDIIKTSDGFYILTGAGQALKINDTGDLIWRKVYPFGVLRNFTCVSECPDGNYILGGYTQDVIGGLLLGIVAKVDTSGTIIWKKEYTINSAYNYNDVKITKTNTNIFMAGWEYEPAYDLCFTAILKMDFSGNVLDTLKYNFYNTDNYVTDIKALNDNKIVITYVRQSINADTSLSSALIIDSKGRILLNREYTGAKFIWLSKIYTMQPNTIYLVGTSTHRSFNKHAFLIKTDTTLYAPPVSVSNMSNIIPEKFTLSQNFPNPFNGSTLIKFTIRKKGVFGMKIYDITGKIIKELFNQELEPGEYKTIFDAENISSGMYFYQIYGIQYTETKKMIFIK